jgi:hypothetical protein
VSLDGMGLGFREGGVEVGAEAATSQEVGQHVDWTRGITGLFSSAP